MLLGSLASLSSPAQLSLKAAATDWSAGASTSMLLGPTPAVTPVFSSAASPSAARAEAGSEVLTKEQRAAINDVVRESTNKIWFEKNVGQFAPGVLYGFRTQFGGMLIYSDHVRVISRQSDAESGVVGLHTTDITFAGANPWEVVPGAESEVTGTYQRAGTAALHPTIYKELTLRGVYEGVDLRFYSAERGALEFDWVVARAQDYEKIRMNFTGQDGLAFHDDGSASVQLRYQDLALKMPEVYQVVDGQKRPVSAAMVAGNTPSELRYSIKGDIVGDQPLIIDPSIAWSTYIDLNDTAYDSYLFGISVNASGVYCLGYMTEVVTNGAYGPSGTTNQYMEVNAGFAEGTATNQNYVYRLNNAGTHITAWTGTGISGTSNPPADLDLFPDGRVLALFSDGAMQIFSADLVSRSFNAEPVNFNAANSIAIVDNNVFYIGGTVTAAVPGAQLSSIGPDATYAGSAEGLIVRYNNATTTPTATWGTYVGGDSTERFTDIAMTPDKTKLVFSVFTDGGASFPTLVNPVDSTISNTELVVGVLPEQATVPSAFNVLSFLGGSNSEGLTGSTNTVGTVVVASNTGFWVGGNTSSTDLPGTTGGAQPAAGGGRDAFVSYIPINGSAGTGFQTSYLGGSGNEIVGGIAYDPVRDRVLLFGSTTGSFPTLDTSPSSEYFDSSFGGGIDIFIATFNGALTNKEFATYIGGTGNDYLGSTGLLRGSGHVTYSAATDQVYLATTVHSVLDSTVIGTPPGKDNNKSNSGTGQDVHVIFAFNSSIFDHGDAPVSYEGSPSAPAAEALSPLIRLGATEDAEVAALSGSTAAGDDAQNTGSANDEDGIATLPLLPITATTYSVNVSVFNNTGATSTLQGWIDFNRDGVFSANERASATVTSSASQQSATLTWSTLPGLTTGQSYLRLRFSETVLTDSVGTTIDERSIGTNTNSAGHGEVEDYGLYIDTVPVAVADSYSTQKNTALPVTAPGVLSNDTDADSNPLSAVLVTGVSHGSLTLNANGSFSYTPTTDYVGPDSFTYKANDGYADSNVVTVSLTVTPVNAAPVAVADSYSTNEDTTLTVPVTGVLGNDTDADSDPLTAVLVTGVSHGSLTLNANGSFTYTPAANYFGPDSFTYKANDGIVDSNIVTVSLTVNPVNDAPVAVANSYTTAEDTALTVSGPGVLANDSDVEGNSLSAVLVTGVSHGSLTLNANGSFTYTPAANYNGPDSYTYKANDGALDSNVVTVSITVTPANDAPVAVANSYTTAEDTALTVNTPGVLGNDTDLDGDALTSVLVTGVSHGSLTLNANGSFTYTPAANYNGPDSFTYKANDGTADSNVVTVSLTVTPANDAPVAVANSYTTAEDTALTVNTPGVLGNDTDLDGDALTSVLVTGVSHGSLTLNANGSFTYTPAANYNGPDSFTYKANDGTADSNVVTVSLTVTPVNDAPVAVADSYTTNEDTALTVPVTGVLGNDTDLDGDALTSVVVTGVGHGSLTLNANGSFTYTPTANYNGPDSFTYKANDGTTDSNVVTVSITVTPANDAPVAVADSYTTAEDTALTVNIPGVLGNDTDLDGDALTSVLVTGVSHGSLTLNANGSFTYTPTANYNGPDSFTYKANDGTADSNVVTVSLTVTPANDAPVAVANSYTTAEDTALTVNTPGVLGNDTDLDGDALTSVLVTGVSHGTLTLNANGSFTYTPAANYSGPDSFTYKANDGTTNSNVVTVSLTVTPVNDAPVAVANSFTTNEDTALTVPAPGILGNDTDADGDALTSVLVTDVTHGTLVLNSNGSFTYTPTANYSGLDSFTYKANDGTADSNVATVTITVAPVNDAPVAVNDSYTTNEDTALTVSVPGILGNDTDAEEDALTAVVVTGVSHGSLTLNANGSFTYTPTANYSGADSFTYKANDGTTDSNAATVNITVTPVNDAPVAVNDSYSTSEDTVLTVPVTGILGNDTDAEGSALTAALVTGATHGTLVLNSNGSFTYTPAANYSGADSFTYKANDGTTDSNVATVNITVTPVNDAPVAVADSFTTSQDTLLTVPASGILGNDSDVDGDALSAVLVTDVSHGTLTLNANGGLSYTPASAYLGADSFTYKVNDGTADSNVVTVSITVLPINHPPVLTEPPTLNTLTGIPIPVPTTTTDPDGDTVTVTFTTPAHGVITGTGPTYTYKPNPGYTGTDTFTGTASDGRGGTDTKTTVVTITSADALVGNYSVLLTDTNGDVAAHLLMTTTRTGRATGVVTVGGIRYTLRGFFAGGATTMFPRLAHFGTVQLDLSMDLTNPGGAALVVAVTDGQGTYSGRTVRSPYSPQHPAPQAGKYTIIVSRDARVSSRAGLTLAAADPGTPTVASVIAVRVRTNGAVTFNGVTGNNYRITCSSYIMPGNLVPFYAGRIAPGASVQYSTFTFPTDPALGTVDPNAPAISGLMRWNAAAGPRLSAGVDAEYAVLGGHYTQPVSGVGVLNVPQLTLHLDVPSFTAEGLNPSYNEVRTFLGNVLPQNGGYVSPVRVSLSNGMYIGKIQGRVPRPFFGIILQGEGIDGGLGSLLDYTSLSTCELHP